MDRGKLTTCSRKRLGECVDAYLTLEGPFNIGCQLDRVSTMTFVPM
jgi:hypothetical protein